MTEEYLLHCTYHGVLPPWVRLSFVSVAVALGAGVAFPGVTVPLWAGVAARASLPVDLHPPSGGFVVVPPSAACSGRRGDVLPRCCAVLLSCAGG